MTKQFDAVKWLRVLVRETAFGPIHSQRVHLLKCADELAAAKARVEGLQAVYGAAVHQIEAEQAISRKLYEALKSYSTSFNPIATEALAVYEKERK